MIYTEENYKNAKSGDIFDFICPVCGKTFHKTKRQISKNSGIVPKYCSQKCSRMDHVMKMVAVVCKECGKEYEIDKYTYDRKIEEGSEFFCSRSCSAKYNNKNFPKRKKTSATDICPVCGGKKSSASGVCNKCRQEERSKFIMSQELGYYIGYDKKYPYVTRKCSEIRREARRIMDNDTTREKVCEYCHNHEFDEVLEVHHLKGITKFDVHTKVSEINDKSNLIWLCPNHHRMLERGLIKLE